MPEPISNRRLRAILGAAFVAAILVFGTIATNWPFNEDKVSKALEALSGRKVVIGKFQKTYFPPGFVAMDIQFMRHDPACPPMISVRKLVVRDAWREILTFRHYIPSIDVYETHFSIPPRGVLNDKEHHTQVPPLTNAAEKKKLEVNVIRFHQAMANFLPGQRGSEPFRIPIRELTLTRIGSNKPFGFEGVVENPLPHGVVYEKGTFGPWDAEDPSRTPINGMFIYQNAQLHDIPGIAGTLRTEGKFHGTLDRIEVEGAATVPDFRVLRSVHSESLTAKYRAAVDATNGNVELKQLDTTFGHTTVSAQGRISGEPNHNGRFTALTAQVDGGRVEDLEDMFTHSKLPSLVGTISLRSTIDLPPGDEPFLRRLQMAGHFETVGDKFHNPKTQGLLNRLAESGKGETKKEQNADSRTVRSAMKSQVAVRGGVARISGLLLTAPETAARMDGTFDLISKDVDLKGTLKTDGKLSDTQTGFKSFAVKIITPFMKKHGSTVVPFEIKGKIGDLSTKLDLGAKRRL